MSLTTHSDFQNFFKTKGPKVPLKSVESVLAMSEEGNTVPFMARYRKERTGNLDEVQIRDIIKTAETFSEVVKRKTFVLEEVAKQGALTDELKKQIEASFDLGEIEELYRPYKRKKKTKAKMAKDAGLEPLADWVWQIGHGELQDDTSLEVKAKDFLNPAAGFATYQEALRGAQHIIVEKLCNNLELRQQVRDDYFKNAKVFSEKGPKFKPNSKFQMYAEFNEAVKTLKTAKASHRYLAIRRGWQEGELKVTMKAADEDLLKAFEAAALTAPQTQAKDLLLECAKLAFENHVVPSVSNEIHRLLKDTADEHAIYVFAENVRRVLMASPFGPKVVLGVDPGLKTGCKVALIDKGGNYISHTVMHILGDGAEEKAKKLLGEVTSQIEISVVAVGNGTGGREAEAFIRKVFKELGKDIPVAMVNESGASVYSASDVAREEFPDLDLTVRGAISIARRLQDPLAELVKIEPKSIGVGQYQHDVGQTQLKNSLHDVVESCVNQVGVDLNTASHSLLQYVAGIGPAIAKNIVSHRKEKGLFKDRNELLQVSHFSSKSFEQAAGFLRVFDGGVPLDQTGIHPERYQAVKDMVKESGLNMSDILGGDVAPLRSGKEKWSKLLGEFTFEDILSELSKPARDPRDPYKVFQYRDDIHEVKDLKKDMICPGIVTNVTNFGAFVDIGVHQDGLVHISELTHDFVSDPRLVVSPGDQVQVKVLGVETDKNQISLSMLMGEKPKVKARPPKGKSAGGKKRSAKPDGKSRGPSGKGRRPDGPRGGKNQKPRGGGQRPPRKPAKPFNNPFAALGDLSGDSKN